VSQPKRSQAETVISGVEERDGGADPTELLLTAQPVHRRPNGACNTSHIMPPSRIWATWLVLVCPFVWAGSLGLLDGRYLVLAVEHLDVG
jgi:hypothetical protein